MRLRTLENPAEHTGTQTEKQPGMQKNSGSLVFKRDYLKVTWPEVPDPFLVCLDRKKLGLLNERFPGLVIYFAEELREMAKFADDRKAIMGVHLVKKEFLRSWVVPSDPVESNCG